MTSANHPVRLNGILHTVANNAEPIKLFLYIAPILLATIWVRGLYADKEIAKLEADASSLREYQALVDQKAAIAARFLAQEQTTEAIAVALDAIPRNNFPETITESAYLPTVLANAILKHRERARIPGNWKDANDRRKMFSCFLTDIENVVHVYDIATKSIIDKHEFLPILLESLPDTPNEQLDLTAFSVSDDNRFLIARIEGKPKKINYQPTDENLRKKQISIYVYDTITRTHVSTSSIVDENSNYQIQFSIDPDSQALALFGSWGLSVLNLTLNGEYSFGEGKFRHILAKELGGYPTDVFFGAGDSRMMVTLATNSPHHYPNTAKMYSDLNGPPVKLGNFPPHWNEIKPNKDFSAVLIVTDNYALNTDTFFNRLITGRINALEEQPIASIETVSWAEFQLEISGNMDTVSQFLGLNDKFNFEELRPFEYLEFSHGEYATVFEGAGPNNSDWLDFQFFDVTLPPKIVGVARANGSEKIKRRGNCFTKIYIDSTAENSNTGQASVFQIARTRKAVSATDELSVDFAWRDNNSLVWASSDEVNFIDLSEGKKWTAKLDPPAVHPYYRGSMVDLSPQGRFLEYRTRTTGEPVVVALGDGQISLVISTNEDSHLILPSDKMAFEITYGGDDSDLIQMYALPDGNSTNFILPPELSGSEFIHHRRMALSFYDYETGLATSAVSNIGVFSIFPNPFDLQHIRDGIALEAMLGDWQSRDAWAIRSLETGDALWTTPSDQTSQFALSPDGERVAYIENNTVWVENLNFAPGPIVEIACQILPFNPSETDYSALRLPISNPICQGNYRASQRQLSIEQFWRELRE